MKKIIITIIIIIIAVIAIYLFWIKKGHDKIGGLSNSSMTKTSIIKSEATKESLKEISTYQYTENYSNSDYGFGFKYPKNFSVTEAPGERGDIIVISDDLKKIGVQLLISPFEGEDIDMTVAEIKLEIPDITITEPQELLVGTSRKGLAFFSDNEDFGGKSREVWFVYKGNIYQISTYAEQDDFLKGLFGTWQFK